MAPGEAKSLLRFITCGSVDDGKSTLIGRLLFESHLIPEDQLTVLEIESKTVGTQGGELDFALLVDGLSAEREQGITIDVAYRFFSTSKRSFIVADTPGHEQYTRNMVTAASTASVAVLLVDARKGLLTQTKRHAHIASLLGIRSIVLAVNKLDLVDYDKTLFEAIELEFKALADEVTASNLHCIPVSALKGDNIVEVSKSTPWYKGPSLLGWLESVEIVDPAGNGPFRFLTQWVNRPHHDFRGYSGIVVGGSICPGDEVVVAPSGQRTSVERIVTMGGDLPRSVADQSVTLTLTDNIDVSRGDVLYRPDSPPSIGDAFEADVVWMHEDRMLPGRPYLLKLGTRIVGATITRPKYRVNVNTLEHVATHTLELNEIGVCNIHTDQKIVFDPYAMNRDTGGFILIDRLTNQTVGVGLIHFELHRSQNLHWQPVDVDREAHAALKGHRPHVVWFTGLSGAGKSTVANLVERRLHSLGIHTVLLDGDNVRQGLNKDLGFTDADRVENIRRVAEVSRLMVDAGLIVLVSFISPFESERQMAREVIPENEFCEVFVDTPIEVAESRDSKGLYAKARRGELSNFTGVDSPYEPPRHPEVHLDGAALSPHDAADMVIAYLHHAGSLDG